MTQGPVWLTEENIAKAKTQQQSLKDTVVDSKAQSKLGSVSGYVQGESDERLSELNGYLEFHKEHLAEARKTQEANKVALSEIDKELKKVDVEIKDLTASIKMDRQSLNYEQIPGKNRRVPPSELLNDATERANHIFGIPISGGFKTLVNIFRPHITNELEYAQSKVDEQATLKSKLKKNEDSLAEITENRSGKIDALSARRKDVVAAIKDEDQTIQVWSERVQCAQTNKDSYETSFKSSKKPMKSESGKILSDSTTPELDKSHRNSL